MSGSINNSTRFEAVDGLLTSAGIPCEERMQIYRTLAAILHLGNVVLEETFPEGKIQISYQTIDHLKNVARLLKIDWLALEKAVLTRTIEVNGEPIT